MVADTKKVQSAINRVASILVKMEDVVAIKDAFIAADPDVTGTPLAGNKALVNQLLLDIQALTESAVAVGVKAAVVPSHRGEAL